jgi:uncharacterized protein (DUF58 family)
LDAIPILEDPKLVLAAFSAAVVLGLLALGKQTKVRDVPVAIRNRVVRAVAGVLSVALTALAVWSLLPHELRIEQVGQADARLVPSKTPRASADAPRACEVEAFAYADYENGPGTVRFEVSLLDAVGDEAVPLPSDPKSTFSQKVPDGRSGTVKLGPVRVPTSDDFLDAGGEQLVKLSVVEPDRVEPDEEGQAIFDHCDKGDRR